MRRRSLASVLLVPLAGVAAQFASATPTLDEQKLIEALIERVSKLNGFVFLRNGGEHSPANAAEHLQSKFDYFKSRIVTAEDFIALCATKSEMTGERYRVKDSKGVVQMSDAFMKQTLQELRGTMKRGMSAR